MSEDTAGAWEEAGSGSTAGAAEDEEEAANGADQDAERDLILATARRIIASDAAIIHRLGTI